jgi:hypothetical protein
MNRSNQTVFLSFFNNAYKAHRYKKHSTQSGETQEKKASA